MKTFVVRLYVPAEPKPPDTDSSLRGLVEEVGSGRRASFAAGPELLVFLKDRVHDAELQERSSS